MSSADDPLDGPPSGEWRFTVVQQQSDAKRLVAELAARQFGRVRIDQLRHLGVSEAQIRWWRQAGHLHPELPHVYAVGHPGRTTESDLVASVLYAGPGAMLSHVTAAWWLGLLKYAGKEIIASTPRRIANRKNIVARARSRGERTWLTFCQNQNIPIPQVNVYVRGWLVDAHWPEHKLVVEIDGPGGHRTPAQLQADHQRDLELRAAGYTVLRYTERRADRDAGRGGGRHQALPLVQLPGQF